MTRAKNSAFHHLSGGVLLAFALLAACSPAAPPTQTASTPSATDAPVTEDIALHASVFFLGRTDSSGDGQVSLSDEVALYANVRTVDTDTVSEPSQRLSAEGVNVLQFDTATNGEAVAYIAQPAPSATNESNSLVLEIVQVSDLSSTRVTLTDLTAATAQFFEDAIWVSGYNADGMPLLRGLNPTNGEVIGERVFETPTAQITLDPSGQWALNFMAETGAVEVFSLPAFEPVALELPSTGTIVDAPQWSPSLDGERFVTLFAAANNPANFGLWIVDAEGSDVQAIDLPDYEGVNRVSATWSDHGEYVVTTARQAAPDPSGSVPPITIIDAAADASTAPVSLQEAGFRLSVFGWSSGDAFALVLKQPVNTSNRESSIPVFPEFMLYNSASQQLTPLESMAQVEPQTAKWSPTETRLGILGQSLLDGQYGVYALSAAEDTLTTLLSSFDTGLTQGNIYWTQDGAQVIVLAPSTDSAQGLITTPLGTPFALFVLDVASEAVVRLSPEGIAVDLYNVNVQ
ncbi:MAG: hypothetical protein H7175_28870 [Burkholderiales bacterium]|nr:hypothetical protein [Anaerolineae bacterium]